MLGLMMKTPLLLSSILTHAARSFPDVEIVSRTPDHPDHRTNYAGLLKRSSQLANALTALGVKRGRSRRDAGLERHTAISSCITASPGSARFATP